MYEQDVAAAALAATNAYDAALAKAGVEPVKGTKDTNPKDGIGIRKTPWSVIPMRVIAELGLALLEGACKYRRHNYRVAGVRASVYMDATFRHLAAWWEGEDVDPDSNLSHITKAIASLTVLRDSMISGNWNDDRPPVQDAAFFHEYNKHAEALVAKGNLEPYTQLNSRSA
jgi:hypothetical protein